MNRFGAGTAVGGARMRALQVTLAEGSAAAGIDGFRRR